MGFYSRHILPHLINLTMGAGMLKKYRQRTVAKARGVS